MDVKLDRVQLYLDWLKSKLYLDHQSNNASKRKVKRGNVYYCYLGRGVGSEEEKERPCVVLQRFDGNMNSPNTIVAPITHTSSTLDVVVPINTRYNQDGSILLDGNVLLGNIVTVSKARLGDYIATLTTPEMKQVDIALAKSIDIYKNTVKLENIIKDKDIYIGKLIEQRENLQRHLDELINSKDKK
ncbi:type II toxin-antitoxin system PemK/MazF family toxin [Desulfosporosinus lacus]|uniref:mRNA interferase MazF n=1 Tax=Desulfosporosinus lacus DSM 15449 TaxID=1121420 RepID=A0A1M5VHS2_9FIRM|nr:type II toxin-antitoxin system PemK/MazF family toxin [Desulfosporosinus lacus]SHH74809.1 mRNA interferase MazF [Desulfosporosinus lacus DSM 15449]